ncbi:cytochrome P450 monooxygenase [Didymella exigua CBS 183.55]|uniref:Cytochrome P450 monooxygenase n=1 Tax=Didymella exigua CBS 183.55 TaxID=1150837 RepID=A0A6A5R845_9PLEO|nr:cytochrome P450 monooxygenase [Didymella exigua CBS 183.55]KAF1923390.1 cytochrome P450 monooxygenase [Didymella exigua CBS 183.55]
MIKFFWLLFPVAFIGYVALKCLYNIYLHPLRSYPGPLAARASVLPSQKNLLRGRLHLWTQDLHRQYGPVVRLSPNELSFIDPDVWKDVYGHRASAFTKSLSSYGPDVHGNPPGILRAENADHARQRKTVSHAFSDKALREQEELLKSYVSLLVEKLQGIAAGQLQADLVQWYNFTTFDIMADLTFGESLNQLSDSGYHPWVWAVFSHIKLISLSRVCREWPGLSELFQNLLPKDAKEKRRQHLEFSANMLKKRMARETERPDIWTFVSRNAGQKGGLHATELNSNGAFFMLAGTETTATELAGLTFMLLKNPDKMQRLTDEIRSSFNSTEDMNMSSLSRLQYLGACIEEGLRLYPPVPGGLARVTPQDGASVCGRWIPGGTIVQAPIYSIHRSPTNFKDSDSFKPERFLAEGHDIYLSDRRDAMNPFSTGPRNCLGKNLAYHEMRLVMASVLLHFDLELCDTTTDWLHQDMHLLWDKNPLMVKLRAVQ